ncbi:PAS domain S-box protein [Laspinema olomoucense]|uniref:PAS domain S-box protein n=1 Tax=Laspinema olomoucense TaxID=3231600 RepID=UPI0021BAFCA2|nr:PAS domain S-box protein [Laspinema sp. D3a]MCT7990110.1 PAS domain S-box protein [Laspinema sp. D3a]
MNRILLLIEEQGTRHLLIQQLGEHYQVVTVESNSVEREAAEVHRGGNRLDLCIGDRLGLEAYQGSWDSHNPGQAPDFPLLLVIHPGEWGILQSHREGEDGATREQTQGITRYDDAIAAPIQPEELFWRVEKLLNTRVGVSHPEPCTTLDAPPPELGESLIASSPHLQRHLQQHDQLFRAFVEEIRDYAIFLLDSTGRIASWNRGAQRLLGYSSAEIIGNHFSCFYPEEDIATGKPQQELQLVATAGQCEDEGWRRRRNGTRFWANITLSALQDAQGQLVGFSVIAHDLSDRKAVEMELCSLNRALTTIWECNQAMVRAQEESELLHEICRSIVETGGYRLAWVALSPAEEAAHSRHPRPLQPAAFAGEAQEYLQQIQAFWKPNPEFAGITRTCIQTGKCCLVQNIQIEPSFGPWRELALHHGLHSTIALPLISKDKTFGSLRIYSGTANAFDIAEVELLGELANDLAYGIVALRDRAERQRAESALAKSEERYRRLVELSPEAIIVHSGGKIDFINTAGAKLLGATTPEALVGLPVLDFVHPDKRALVEEGIKQILTEHHAVPFIEQQFVRLDGTIVPVELAATPIGEKNGILNLLTVARDLSDRKRIEAALRASEELHRITLTNISEAVFITDRNGALTYISPAVRFICDYSVEEAQQWGHISHLLGDHLFEEDELGRLGEIHNLERTIVDKRGNSRTLLVSVKQVEIEGGTLLYTCRDITERKQAEEALRESEHRFRTIFEGAAIGMKITDLEGRFLQTNPALQGMLGYTHAQLCDFSFDSITYAEDLPISRQLFHELVAGERDRYQLEKRYIHAQGHCVWVRLSVSSIRDTQNCWQFAIGLVEDITERKQAEEELRLYRNHLEELVADRTAELQRINERLRTEISRREQAQQALIRVTQAVESTSDAVLTIDITGQAIYHNRAFLDLFECTVEELNQAGGLPSLFADSTLGQEVFNQIHQGNSWSSEVLMRGRTHRSFVLSLGGDHTLINTFSIWLRADAVTDEHNQRVGSICVLTDITDRKQTEAALRESEDQLRTLINAMPDAICFKDGRGAWLEANQAMLKLFELKDLNYQGKTDAEIAAFNLFYRDAFLECDRSDEEAWKYGILSHKEEVIPTPDGSQVILDTLKVPLFHSDGSRKGLVVIGRDVTERKQVEEERLRLASIVESSDDAIIGKTLDGVILSWNTGAQRIYGYTAEEVKGRSISILILPDRQESELRLLEGIRQGSSIDHYETVHLKKEGSPIYVSLTISPIKDAAGRITGVSTIARDVTDLKRVEDSLERLRHQNELILNSAGEGICGMDIRGNTTFINPAATKMLGYLMGELLGAPLTMILGSNFLPQEVADPRDATAEGLAPPLYAAISDGSVHHGTAVFWRKDGTSFPVEYITTPIQEQNEIKGAVLTFKDITERQGVERMKDEFISVVSHELRTPLTSIRGSLGLLANGLLESYPEKAERMLQIAVSNTDRLVRLINDILDLERIQSGKVTMVEQFCNAADLTIQAADAMRTMADKAGVTICVNPIPVQLWADPDRIFQVLTNLLSNALKFSPEGGKVWLSASLTSAGSPDFLNSQTPEVLFQIKDQGRGIPGDKLETIFERFQQVDASDSRKKGGTGLGLAICRSIVEHHGGQIWVESVVGEGSSFYFTLPVERPNSDSGEENSDFTGAATQDLGIAVESGDRWQEPLTPEPPGPAHSAPRVNSATPSPIVEVSAPLKPRS